MTYIITDSAADITLAEAEKMQIRIVPLTITFADGECPQETEADFEIFYRRLAACEELPKTSQPPLDSYLSIYEEARAAGEDVLVLTLSGGLSGTVQAAQTACQISGYDRVFVVDTHQAILSQRMLVEEAVKLRDAGQSAAQIAARMEYLRDRVTVSGVVDTLKYLQKGGRVPTSLAMLGTALKIKPVIALQETKLQTIGKAMGRKAGVRMLWERLEKYPPQPGYPILFGYSSDREITREFMEETIQKYSLQDFEVRLCRVGGVIGTHVGTSCIALCYMAQQEIP